ncbi:MAG: bifunctional (p)ppGpp synthetase/guanosine-3',5'-bis(diphosphate) 3'-pyrophosphohydrolase [Amphritea sp.]|nr:bifunctional (p)ppGpp synthetase/guanosine-3',5'-bis(diphosphate) 3'-pyrophosphohydrolase [Amphritea sp.]
MAAWNQDLYTKTWCFASEAHLGQLLPGSNISYINHLGNVAQEVMAALANGIEADQPDLALQCALLHDTIEDTDCTFEQVCEVFGLDVANGVMALSKDACLSSKEEMMVDSLIRIKQQPKEVWMVKLADRISNLQKPPSHWNQEKMQRYKQEAQKIHDALGGASPFLAHRLQCKIDDYDRYMS